MAWFGPTHTIGEDVGRDRSKMRGDSPFRCRWIWKGGDGMEG